MEEQWIHWEPNKDLGRKYTIETLRADFDGLNITLHAVDDIHHKIKVICKPYAEAYRQNSEHFRLEALCHRLSQKYGSDYCAGTFFEVLNSEYLVWLDEESGTISSYCGVRHFCILGTNSIIDIATRCEPQINIIGEQS